MNRRIADWPSRLKSSSRNVGFLAAHIIYTPRIMRHPSGRIIFALGFISVWGTPLFAQNKTACELLSKTDAEAILGVTLQPPRPYAPFRSLLDNQDFIDGKPGEEF